MLSFYILDSFSFCFLLDSLHCCRSFVEQQPCRHSHLHRFSEDLSPCRGDWEGAPDYNSPIPSIYCFLLVPLCIDGTVYV